MRKVTLVLVVVVLAAGTLATWSEPVEARPSPVARKAPATKPARTLTPIQQKALDRYNKIVDCYMHSDFDGLKVELAAMRLTSKLPVSARSDLAYIRRMIPEYRPAWWKNCRSASSVSFRARIWGRPFIANYTPAQPQSKREAVKLVNNRIQIIAQWQPHMVDNPQPVSGALAKAHGLKSAHVGEAVVWYELGRNYVPTFIPVKQAVFLYQKHGTMFSHVQEFLAGMSSLHHSSPKARLASLFIQIDTLKKNEAGSAYTRASHAVGAIILAKILMAPEKWPGFKLPTKVPKATAELSTIQYVYNRIDPKWSLAEDKALRDMARKFVLANGKTILTSNGTIMLPNKLPMNLMAANDRQAQALRDAWVAAKLTTIIKASGKGKSAPAKK
ncbi:MAG: hypothetical protein QGG42_21290 [Phycisphaerae bacterium]|jgi:hypothetical protein|nr:hypothetical protein [Phycisphaerae bacterium]